MLAEAEVHGDGGVDGQSVQPILGSALRLGAPTDESCDLKALALREAGAKLAEDIGVEGALSGGGVEVDFDAADAGKAGGLEQSIGGGAAVGFVVCKTWGGFDAGYGFCPDGWRNENSLAARDDGDFISYEDAFCEEGDTEALRVGGAEVFGFLPGPEDDGWGLESGAETS